MIKVLIVDDEALIRSGLTILLNNLDEVEVVGQASHGREAVDFCQDHEVDCVLMDIRMPEVNGIEGGGWVKEEFPYIQVLMLTTFKDMDYIRQAMQAGASGYLLKDSSPQQIAAAIHMVMDGQLVFDGQLNEQMAQQWSAEATQTATDFHAEDYGLKDSDIQLIRLVATGLSNQEIADQVFLSVGTVKNNISTILQKLGLRDRTQLAIFAFEQGLK